MLTKHNIFYLPSNERGCFVLVASFDHPKNVFGLWTGGYEKNCFFPVFLLCTFAFCEFYNGIYTLFISRSTIFLLPSPGSRGHKAIA